VLRRDVIVLRCCNIWQQQLSGESAGP